MQKTRVAVLRGGPSDEYDVSLMTGSSVLENMDLELFQPIDVIISKAGEWLVDGKAMLPEKILNTTDVVFIALHGKYGEDGKLQRFLDRYKIPYTGSKAYASALAMNKPLTKEHLKDAKFKLPHHMIVSHESLPDIGHISEKIISTFGPQYVIKPISSGSSVGTKIIKDYKDLYKALKETLEKFDEVMVEERIIGREATCGVIERYRDRKIYALPPVEIVVPDSADFFDKTVKYDGTTKEICPSTFSKEIKKELEELSVFVHETLGLSQYSRSDFIVSDKDIYFLEVNTLPGLTEESLLPKEIKAVGGAYSDFITHLLTDARSAR